MALGPADMFRIERCSLYKGEMKNNFLHRDILKLGLYRILVYSWFGLDRFIQNSGLFRAWFRQVYSEFWFIQGLV